MLCTRESDSYPSRLVNCGHYSHISAEHLSCVVVLQPERLDDALIPFGAVRDVPPGDAYRGGATVTTARVVAGRDLLLRPVCVEGHTAFRVRPARLRSVRKSGFGWLYYNLGGNTARPGHTESEVGRREFSAAIVEVQPPLVQLSPAYPPLPGHCESRSEGICQGAGAEVRVAGGRVGGRVLGGAGKESG